MSDGIELENDEIGRLGQNVFVTWCTQSKIAAVKADPDKYGWDYILQFPAPHGPHEAPERSCKVQVKTTTGDAASADIKLDNWERMVKERIPWFVVHIHLVDREPRAVHVVHIGEQQVIRVLARIREVGDGADLRKQSMSVSAQPEDALRSPFSGCLREQLLTHIGTSDKAYLESKAAWIEKSGYPEQPYAGTITFEDSDDDEFYTKAADWAIGLLPELPVKRVQVSETRFGIERPVKDVTGAIVKIEPPLVTEAVTISNQNRSEEVSIACRKYIANSQVIPGLPLKYYRFRFVAPYFSLLLHSEDGRWAMSFQLHVPTGADLPLSELSKACRVLRLLSQGQCLTIRFGSSDALTFQGPAGTMDPEFQRFAGLVECVASIARHFDLDANTMIETDDLLDDEFQIVTMYAGFNRGAKVLGTSVSMSSSTDLTGKRAVSLVPCVVYLGTHVAIATFATTGTAKWEFTDSEHGSLTLDHPAVEVHSKKILGRPEWESSDQEAQICAMVDEGLAHFDKEGFEVLVGPPGTAERHFQNESV